MPSTDAIKMKARHRANPDHVRALDRARYYRNHERMIQKLTANTRRWRRENPEKYRAQNAVNNALRAGRLEKGPCEICGSTERVHGHHDDYSHPLDVRWLCPAHHGEERW